MILEYKNANIFYTDEGKGTAVVLIHGFLENTAMWQNIVPALSKKNRIITIDLLGHGKSDCLGYIHSMEMFAETINAVLKHLKIRKCILVGHSLGGYVTLAFAEKYPQKIKGLCLLNSTSNEDDEERKTLRLRANKMIQHNFTNMVRMSFANLFGKKSKKLYKEEINAALQEALQTPIQGYIAAQEGMRIRTSRNSILIKNDFKKLIIIGEKDPVLDFETSLEEAKKTNTELVVFPNGHMSHIENKEELITVLKEFVKKL
ncbi:alpha/beta hydrolase [Polaribacter sp. PL03]|uniref:alpha/beta fold hydrolase n=1 Tax=Polaribacter sp. PL03 TaxID=3088353 RepID=UPI0029D1C13B|nr:alpha/beta hydrolase [Polaribacter sp. PL03]MDX6745478.1 alpha/beta hydrolase [Polaribacter sp. PL03]